MTYQPPTQPRQRISNRNLAIAFTIAMLIGAGLFAAGLVRRSDSSGDPKPAAATVGQPSAAATSAPPEPFTQTRGDERFIAELRKRNMTTLLDGSKVSFNLLPHTGRMACISLQQGDREHAITDSIKSGYTRDEATAITDAAVPAYCP